MAKKRDTAHQRMLSSVRKMLSDQHRSAPVPNYNGKAARIDAAAKRARRSANAPTDEALAKATFVEVDVNEFALGYDEEGHSYRHKVRIGRAYQRQARFETIDGLTVAQILALRRYRKEFDTSELSPMKSALDVGAGRGGSPADTALTRIEALAFADIQVRRLEAAVSPNLLPVLRAIGLRDDDFKTVALARYSSSSGKRRTQVRAQFIVAADQLARGIRRAAAPRTSADQTSSRDDAIVEVDPRFLDKRGLLRPWTDIAAIVRGADPAALDAA